MRIQVFVVTYNCDLIHDNINSLLASDLMQHEHAIHVIDNYHAHDDLQQFCMHKHVHYMQNTMRPSWSCGHLARNWNQALLHGFKDLTNPASDVVVCCQDDNVFLPQWCNDLLQCHEQYDFITMGAGDQFHSYRPRHVQQVGLWDERFCNIGFQEFDYFIRSCLYNAAGSSINDHLHVSHNALGPRFICMDRRYIGLARGDSRHVHSIPYHAISKHVLMSKWGAGAVHWNMQYVQQLQHSLIPNYVYYPYFEQHVHDLAGKNYVVPPHMCANGSSSNSLG